MCQNSEQGRRLIGVISPALARRAPQFEIISKPRAGCEGQECHAMIGRREDQQDAQEQGKQGIGLVKGRGNEDQHQGQEGGEGEPVERFKHKGHKAHEGFSFAFLCDLCVYKNESSCDSIDRKACDRPGWDDPQRRPFAGVIKPQVCLRAPGLDRQPAADPHEYDQGVRAQVGTRHDGQGHEEEDADQQPVHVQPPRAVPVHVFENFNRERPPDVNDEKQGDEEAAQQNAAVPGPETRSRGGRHAPNYSRFYLCETGRFVDFFYAMV